MRVLLETTSSFNRDWIKKHYATLIAGALQEALHLSNQPDVDIAVSASALDNETLNQAKTGPLSLSAHITGLTDVPSSAPATTKPSVLNPQLNPKYTFDQFVVGSHNRFCHAAALAVAESPAMSYNPLFLYGGVGLGKTHLMQAIGHHVWANNPNLKVTYVTTEQFTNDLITCLGKQDMNSFRQRYRKIDILLIDDIQFLEGKDRTQEEIFHTFNTLHEAGKQIVISSDRPPERLSRLEDRLRSRFSWGLIADIQPADFETRMAIVQRKAQQLQLSISDDVMAFVSQSFPTNIRELEGALNKLSAYLMLTESEIDLPQAQALLGKRF
ncbi:MAG: chromosomal replication initiator protein DnaA [Vampirovibrionales bacterium]